MFTRRAAGSPRDTLRNPKAREALKRRHPRQAALQH
jgi:hypothetical protein